MGKTDLHYMGRTLHDCDFIKSAAGYDIFKFSFSGECCYVICIFKNVIALFSMYADLEAFIKARNEVE